MKTPTEIFMTPEEFQKWLDEMRETRMGTTDSACARLLGITRQMIYHYKKNGCDVRTALACRALIHRLEPYS